jgi:hypothetical protein
MKIKIMEPPVIIAARMPAAIHRMPTIIQTISSTSNDFLFISQKEIVALLFFISQFVKRESDLRPIPTTISSSLVILTALSV